MLEQDNPVQLDDAERTLLAAYRTESKMPEAARARLIGRLERRRTATVARPATNPWIWVGALAAAAIVVVFVARNLESSRASQLGARDGNQAAMPSAHEGTQGSVEPRAPEAAGHKPRPAQLPAVEPEPTPADPPTESETVDPQDAASPPREPKASRKRRATPPAVEPEENPEPEPAVSPLTEERRLLSAAWRSLARGESAAASRSVKEHAERFPRGVLAIERDAIATIAACQSKSSGARATADRFLAKHGKTPLARRVRAECGVEEKKSPAD